MTEKILTNSPLTLAIGLVCLLKISHASPQRLPLGGCLLSRMKSNLPWVGFPAVHIWGLQLPAASPLVALPTLEAQSGLDL